MANHPPTDLLRDRGLNWLDPRAMPARPMLYRSMLPGLLVLVAVRERVSLGAVPRQTTGP